MRRGSQSAKRRRAKATGSKSSNYPDYGVHQRWRGNQEEEDSQEFGYPGLYDYDPSTTTRYVIKRSPSNRIYYEKLTHPGTSALGQIWIGLLQIIRFILGVFSAIFWSFMSILGLSDDEEMYNSVAEEKKFQSRLNLYYSMNGFEGAKDQRRHGY